MEVKEYLLALLFPTVLVMIIVGMIAYQAYHNESNYFNKHREEVHSEIWFELKMIAVGASGVLVCLIFPNLYTLFLCLFPGVILGSLVLLLLVGLTSRPD